MLTAGKASRRSTKEKDQRAQQVHIKHRQFLYLKSKKRASSEDAVEEHGRRGPGRRETALRGVVGSSPQWRRVRSSATAPQAAPPTADPGRCTHRVRAWPLRRSARQLPSARQAHIRPLGVAPDSSRCPLETQGTPQPAGPGTITVPERTGQRSSGTHVRLRCHLSHTP
ncbi:hypothetical protein NDU88_004703 [Pleurodeles waltl]|uniref:Uncharacterized protein n=1 Tax=Pleurodeles waltl TaxID=8319 RepID=A0AAV7QD18_PLEWA|nr:hypothetical protein NDU88_004703 [Pleurodeles waltl]